MAMIDPGDGGPAFPGQGLFQFHTGMSLRAWYAGQAMAGMAGAMDMADPVWSIDECVVRSVNLADALLAELNRPRAGEAPPPSTPVDP